MKQILISHRGNVNGKFESSENEPTYIDRAIELGFQVEVDVWYQKDQLYLGHNEPLYGVNRDWFVERIDELWIHCKSVSTLSYFNEQPVGMKHGFAKQFNYFYHTDEDVVLTSRGYIWVHPCTRPIETGIIVKPSLYQDDTSKCRGICSDFIGTYKK